MNEPIPPTAIPGSVQEPPSWDQVSKVSPLLAEPPPEPPSEDGYLPLSDTLRLYAGWLLAWYGLVYLLGSFQDQKLVPFSFDFIDNLYQSPLTLQFAFATYLYLLLGTIHRVIGRGVLKGLLCTMIGIALLWGFVMYT